MTLQYCGHCYQRYTVDAMAGDFVHDCNSGQPALDQEDILVIGDSVTEFGETINTDRTPNIITIQGTSNKLQGTMGGVLGGYDGGYTIRGNNKQTMRQRKHFEYIENPKERQI